MASNNSNLRKLFVNSFVMYVRMILLMCLTLYISRVAIDVLGVARFGLYSVISGFVLLAGILTNILESTTQRFLSTHIDDDETLLSDTFRTCFSTHILLSLVAVLLIEVAGWYFINFKLKQNVILLEDIYIVFNLSVLAFFISIIFSPFYAALISFEKTNVYSLFTISEVVIRLVFILIAPLFPGEIIVNYALAIVLSVIINRGMLFIYFINAFSYIKWMPCFNIREVKIILNFAMWNMWGGTATVLNNQGINVLINIFFGVVFNTARAITAQINSAILQITNSIQLALNPQIIKSYCKRENEYLNQLTIYTSKINVYLTIYIIAIIYPNTKFLLDLWLKEYPVITIDFINLMLIDLFINSFSGALVSVIQATGRIKKYQLVVGGTMLINFPLCWSLLHVYENPLLVYYVAIFISVICMILRFYFVKIQTEIKIKEVILKVVFPGAFIIFTTLILQKIFIISTGHYLSILLNILTTTICFSLAVYLVGLDKKERKYLSEVLLKVVRKVVK